MRLVSGWVGRLAAMAEPDRDLPSCPSQGSLESNLARKGLFAVRAERSGVPVESQDLLGLIRSSGLLKVDPDLDVLIWLTEAFRTRGDDEGVVSFTLYELSRALSGRKPTGNDTRRLKASLRRLRTTAVDLVGYDAIGKKADARVASVETLLEKLTSRLDDLDVASGGEAGALRGNTFSIQFPAWIVVSLKAGHVTYYRFEILRKLSGLAKRLWVYLEAERYKKIGQGQEATWIKLGDRAYASLGMHYRQERQARAALKRAGVSICAADPRYEAVSVERRPGGWAVIAERSGRDMQRGEIRALIRSSLPAT